MGRFNYGGQAVMEGVMMRGEQEWAVSVRAPSGAIVQQREALPASYRSRWLKLPFLRGLISLADSLGIGMRALMWSSDVALGEDEEAHFSGPLAWGTVALALAFGVGLFFLLPMFLTSLADRYIATGFLSNLIEGAIRLTFFVAYIALIGLMPDIRRVFAYHGAEHKTINAYEAGAALTPESVGAYSRVHTRCGTGFMLLVMVIFVILSTFLGRPSLPVRLLSRIVLIPVVSGIAYEIVKFSARNYERSRVVRIIMAPGLALQQLTTREPSADMLEVAIASLKAVLAAEGLAPAAESAPADATVPEAGLALAEL
ncbi:MAG: DUF1385 domain-containing protein [Anaerolineae bacterium]